MAPLLKRGRLRRAGTLTVTTLAALAVACGGTAAASASAAGSHSSKPVTLTSVVGKPASSSSFAGEPLKATKVTGADGSVVSEVDLTPYTVHPHTGPSQVHSHPIEPSR